MLTILFPAVYTLTHKLLCFQGSLTGGCCPALLRAAPAPLPESNILSKKFMQVVLVVRREEAEEMGGITWVLKIMGANYYTRKIEMAQAADVASTAAW